MFGNCQVHIVLHFGIAWRWEVSASIHGKVGGSGDIAEDQTGFSHLQAAYQSQQIDEVVGWAPAARVEAGDHVGQPGRLRVIPASRV